MIWFVVKLLIRVVVFGIALGFTMRRDPHVKVEPRSALPLVAATFAVLNTLLYWLIAPALNLVTLFSLSLLVPFLVNGALLYATDRLLKYFKIETLLALAKTAG